jgi:hypothetical protein
MRKEWLYELTDWLISKMTLEGSGYQHVGGLIREIKQLILEKGEHCSHNCN